MVTLVINPGSSSKKYALYKQGAKIFSMVFEKTSKDIGRCTQIGNERVHCSVATSHSYKAALHEMLTEAKRVNAIASVADITTVAFRIVAPGRMFMEHRPIDVSYITALEAARYVVPLHVPPTLEEIVSAQLLLAHAKLVGISDSAFHRTIPEYHYRYSSPEATAAGIRRFGYHGLSVQSVVERLSQAMGGYVDKVVVVHVGSGASVTAVQAGQSVHTTMGYAPASGLLMSSRASDLDPAAMIALLASTKMNLEGAFEYIHSEGGLKGYTKSSDLKNVLMLESKGDHDAEVAVAAFLKTLQAAIAGAVARLGGVDAVVLTATAMERNHELRERLIRPLAFMKLKIDDHANDSLEGRVGLLSTADSVPIVLIPTDEMGLMATLATA